MEEQKKEIILDFGSGNTCQNNKKIIKKMIDELCRVDTLKNNVIIKWQLFKKAGDNIPLTQESFKYAYEYAYKCKYKTTASVFDFESFVFLSHFKDLPFIKLANNPDIYWLQGYLQDSGYKSYISLGSEEAFKIFNDDVLKGNVYNTELFCCVSDYPSNGIDYQERFSKEHLKHAISDHTQGFKLYELYKPSKIEWHYKLNDSIGLDSGLFSRTPEQLKGVL